MWANPMEPGRKTTWATYDATTLVAWANMVESVQISPQTFERPLEFMYRITEADGVYRNGQTFYSRRDSFLFICCECFEIIYQPTMLIYFTAVSVI